MFLEILLISQENTCARVSFLIKLQSCSFIKKETLAQVFSSKFSKISNNTFLTEHLRKTASVKRNFSQVFLKALISAQKLPYRTIIFEKRLPMTASALKHDHNIIVIIIYKASKVQS